MSSNRKKIMMVDDDPVILKIGRHFLMDTYEVYPLPSAAKLFETLEKVIPDLILLDIVMPEVDGVEALKRLKADSRFASIPVIFVTSVGDDKSVFEHLKLGAYSNLTKPFSAEELTERVENCLNDYFPDKAKPVRSEPVAADENEDDSDGKKVILAIDDSPELLRMLYLLLRNDYKVHTLLEPEKLESLLETIKPDLFMLDYHMPELTGLDLIPVIRSFEKHKETPIIFLTIEKSEEILQEAARLGVKDYINKPIKADMLREKVGKHI
ncbi:MAG: response regulator [Oscillospiraceae bacterium]|nr:response regulator [Oscillospiraceae bacterium]